MIQKINSFHAFKPGSELWFFPPKKNSQWLKLIDWYIHFLLSKHDAKSRLKLPEQILEIIKNEEINDLSESQQETHSLMISSSEYLPAKSIIVLKNGDTVASYIENVLSISKNLGANSIRVFLPKSSTFSQVQKNLSESDYEISVVEDGIQ